MTHSHITEEAQCWSQLEFWICQVVKVSGERGLRGYKQESEDDDI